MPYRQTVPGALPTIPIPAVPGTWYREPGSTQYLAVPGGTRYPAEPGTVLTTLNFCKYRYQYSPATRCTWYLVPGTR